jgi:hypothetical protein
MDPTSEIASDLHSFGELQFEVVAVKAGQKQTNYETQVYQITFTTF